MTEASVAAYEPVPDVLAAPRPRLHLKRRVLVTGSSGMLGRDLVTTLAAAGSDVYARPKTELDVTRAEEVARAFRDARPEIVVNCAAFTRVDACETDPLAYEVNAHGVEVLAAECLARGARLVQVSTDFVFDGSKRAPYREDDDPAPLSAYGRSKLAGEQAALRLPTALVVRASWLFGRGGWNFVEAIRKQIADGRRTLTVVDDQRGRPTSTSDLAEALVALLERAAIGIYHFANAGEASWFEFAREIVALSGRGDVEVTPIDSATLGRPANRPPYSVLDTGKYERVTGRPVRHYRDALAEYIADSEPPAA